MSIEKLLSLWPELAFYAPLGIIGAWRWSVWLFQKIVGRGYRPISPQLSSPRPSISVVTPVYNENAKLFWRALRSWAKNEVDEIIAVIDATDKTCIEIFQSFQREFPEAHLIITEVPGKRPALALGARQAASDIIALVDSDTIWDDDIRDSILAPFADPSVGGVATRQAVLSPLTRAERLFNIRFSLRYLHEYPYLATVGDALTCLSGRTAVYRREALLPVLDGMLNETFLFRKCISGEDKRLTSLVMRNGWKVRYQSNAIVRTQAMASLRQFFRQNLRWSRNSWRTDLRLIFSGWTWWREPLFAYHLVDRSLQPFTLLLGPIYFAGSLFFGYYPAAAILATWWILSRTVKLYPHLREHPRDLSMVPIFTLAQYHLAVLKIYALLSLDFQSWLTRWDKKRLRKGLFELLPSQTATLAVVATLSFFVFQDLFQISQARAEKEERLRVAYTDDPALLETASWEEEFWKERKAHEFGTYQARLGDTPNSLKHKFNLPEEAMAELFPGRFRNAPLPQWTEIRIPVEYLTISNSSDKPSIAAKPMVAQYDPIENMIRVKSAGNVVGLSAIARALPPGQDRLVEVAPQEWLLRSRLYMSEGTTLILDGKEVKWLKLESGHEHYSYIRSHHGNILINNTRITSWDEANNDFDYKVEDGRAFIVAYGSGRMDVLHSELSHMGFPLDAAEKFQNFGGCYGLSWKIDNGSFGRNLLTGNMIGNRIHHNYFGMYSYGTTQMIIRDNEFYENIQYGIDPHDDSNNLLIENNIVHHNGNHGIIGSKRVNYSTIRNNRSFENRLHGIMLDRHTNYNLVENNYTSGNVNGVALTESRFNLIRNNTIIGNRFGIRSSHTSSENMLAENNIRSNEKGIYFYDRTERSIIARNSIIGNLQGIHLKETKDNIIKNNVSLGENTLTLNTDEASRKSNYIQSFQ